MDKSIFRKE